MCDDNLSTTSSKCGRFVIKDNEDDEDLKAGSLFARRKDIDTPLRIPMKKQDSKESQPAQIKDTVARLKKVGKDDSSTDLFQSNETSLPSKISGDIMNSKVLTKPTQSKEDNSLSKKENNGTALNTSFGKRKNNGSSTTKSIQKKEKIKKIKLVGKPFGKLLEGVVLVISGYQNPHRGNLRIMALEMGACYKPDWDKTCTHLICAFPNTPKFQQVQGKGYIVRKEWLENCHRNRKRLPWRRYALDKKDLCKAESEDEIPELNEDGSPSSVQEDSENEWLQSGSDTEDEIEKVILANQQDDQTDVESESELPDTDNIPLPNLPNIFTGKYFYLCGELSGDVRKKLLRYIVALDGVLSEKIDDKVDFVISNKKTKLIPVHKVVRPDWIWECNDAGKLLPTKLYEIS